MCGMLIAANLHKGLQWPLQSDLDVTGLGAVGYEGTGATLNADLQNVEKTKMSTF
jgi:hypothetical protein